MNSEGVWQTFVLSCNIYHAEFQVVEILFVSQSERILGSFARSTTFVNRAKSCMLWIQNYHSPYHYCNKVRDTDIERM